ncbi:MAG: septal ring lytic transglycosylase RlpA family protein [Gammaproteobacteria bacterium]|nr:septal ring lytic transglycosylase RlpA family protein [Gammaproteobacteria bacterium]
MRTPLFLLCLLLGIAACVRLPPQPAPDTRTATRADGQVKPPSYVVFGRRYYPIPSAHGYRERGVASWYGGKFHGRNTSNGEVYDMHGMTAAHKTLPLPTWVRVTNLRNGSSVVVRVNDRGPFVKNRLIDLSYEAARRLDMLAAGTTLVEVEAIDPPTQTDDPAAETEPVQASVAAPVQTIPLETAPPVIGQPVETVAAVNMPETPAPAATEIDTPAVTTAAPEPLTALFVQVGAFSDRANAHRMRTTLYNAAIDNVRVADGTGRSGLPVFRVQVGPVADVASYDALIATLETLGISDTHLVYD